MPNLVKDIFQDYNRENNIIDCEIEDIKLFKKSNRVLINLASEKKITLDDIYSFEEFVKKRFKISSVELNITYKNEVENTIEQDWERIEKFLIFRNPLLKVILENSKIEIEGNILYVILRTQRAEFLHAYDFNKTLEILISNLYGKNYKIEYKEQETDETHKKQIEFLQNAEKMAYEEAMHEVNLEQEEEYYVEPIPETTLLENEEQEQNIIFGTLSKARENKVRIKDITADNKKITIEGRLVTCEVRETKTGKGMLIYDIYDGSGIITCKSFTKDINEGNETVEKIKNAKGIKTIGKAGLDAFAGDVTIMANTIIEINAENFPKLPTEDENSPLILGMKPIIKERVVKVQDLNEESGNIALDGEVINIEEKEIKGNRVILSLDLYDGTSTITCKAFVAKDMSKKIIEKIKNSKGIKISGKAGLDTFSNELTIMANTIIKSEGLEKIERHDNSEIKRVELHLHTQMSQMDGVSSATDIIKQAAKWGMKSIAITDHGVVQAFPEANHAVEDLNGEIKVIYGVEAYFVPDVDYPETVEGENGWKKPRAYHAIILAKNYVGLKNLYQLISISHLNYFHKRPRILQSVFEKYREGLIFGSACEQGELYRAIINKKSDEEIERIARRYDYLEIQPLGNNEFLVREETVKDDEELKNINRRIVNLADKLGKLAVATCDVHFLNPQDEIYRRILMAGQGFKDADKQAPLFLRTTEEMINEFLYLGKEKAYEVVVTNTNKISDMCEAICPISKEKCPPVLEHAEEDIQNICHAKAEELYGNPLPEIVEARLKRELDSIIKNGFSTLYIIAQKLVWKSNEDGYLVGSRGSVGSSFVANMLGITEVNSLPPHYRCPRCKYSDFTDYGIKNGVDLPDKICPKCGEPLAKDGMDIPFETFLGFNGDKEPDIDLNFSGEYQGIIHRYAEVIFGKGKTFKAGTVGTIADKTAFGYVKNYFDERNIHVSNAEISRLVNGCTGVKRTTGQHPGGIIVVPHGREIYEFCPVQHPADDPNSDIITTHFDYHSIDKNLLKLDMLGHDDPTVIKMLQDLTGIDPKTIPLDDKETMSLFTSTKALGVTPEQINSKTGAIGIPEFGTKFVRGMLESTKPTTFEELIRISGLSHGTDVWLNNAEDLINSGTVTLDDAICTRDDIMTYLIKKGLPPGDSFKIMEAVRKGKVAKGKEPKWPEYEELMRQNNVPEWYIDSCKKIKYMFPKAHAVAYVTMAFRIAWFKVHYPLAYYCAYFSIRGADDFDSELMINGKEKVKEKMKELQSQGNLSVKEKGVYTILEIVLEMYERGIEFLPIDIYKSHANKFQIEDGKIRPPLSSIAGLGGVAAQSIQDAVETEKGKFISIDDFQIKAKVGKSIIEMLTQFGCFKGMSKSNQLSLFG